MQFKTAERKIIDFFIKNFLSVCSFVFVFGYTLFYLVIPFLRFNKLVNWDLAGLYFSAWYEKLYLFPKIIGWNPFFFMGYAQHQFYPPLYAYLTALLSFFMPLFWAFKIIFALIILLIPLSFYYFVRSFKIEKNISASLMVFMFSMLFLFQSNFYGGNFSSTFHVGLITHAMGMMLFFFYFGALNRGIKSGKGCITLSLLFSAIVLTHIVAAFVAAFVFLSYLICYFNEKKKLVFLGKHWLLSFLLTAFWTIPFIAKSEWLASLPVGTEISLFILAAVVFLLMFILFTKNDRVLPVGVFMVLVLFFSFLATYFVSIPLHLYRFMMYLYLLLPFVFAVVFRRKGRSVFGLIFLVGGVALIVFAQPVHPEGAQGLNTEKLNISLEGGRILVLPSIIREASPHILQHNIPMENGVHAMKGLYLESARNGRYIYDLEQELNFGRTYTWAGYIDFEKINKNISQLEKILPYQFNLFNINLVVGKDGAEGNFSFFEKKQYVSGYESEKYYLYKVGNSSLFEILNYTPKKVYGDWDNLSVNWFLSMNITQGVFVNEDVPSFVADGDEELRVEYISPRQDMIRFFVNSSHEVPVLVKISAFPNWRAYMEGERVKIYTASPYLMLVYGKGNIVFKYENTFFDSMGNWFSIFGVLVVFFLFVNRYILGFRC